MNTQTEAFQVFQRSFLRNKKKPSINISREISQGSTSGQILFEKYRNKRSERKFKKMLSHTLFDAPLPPLSNRSTPRKKHLRRTTLSAPIKHGLPFIYSRTKGFKNKTKNRNTR